MSTPDNVRVIDARIASLKQEIEQLEAQKRKVLEKNVRDTLNIIYSADRKLYYITDGLNMPRAWFGVEKITEQPKENDIFMGGYLSLTMKSGESYFRAYYPFAFWSVKSSGERDTAISIDDDLAGDFLAWAVREWQWKGYDEPTSSTLG
ncbi:hypothetical protein DYQ86_16155 [Acidobacteria bacterium AB60]|nr:hypothetical protein DYQ86_16155 [Acidobacteria bacterium AB60]